MIRHLILSLIGIVGTAFAANTPNIVIIFCDDLGYADIGPFGAQGYSTPHLHKMATQGSKFTNFHVSQPVCSASRASLLTGCYANRVGIHGALSPQAKRGLAASEVTIAEIVKQKRYATCAVGKWHLGHQPGYLPTTQGFDHYLGLPYSNDMWPFHPQAKPGSYPPLPLYEQDQVIDADVTAKDQESLTTRYTERSVKFIDDNHDKPFFLYLAHSMCHVPLFVSEKFAGKSQRGLFGDVLMEIDWSVGQVMAALDRHNIADNTWVIFTSDNGPWLSYGDHAGSAGPLREGKGTCFEGGVRVPCLMRWPGQIPAGVTNDHMAMTIDILPTIANRIGATLPDHKIDGLDLWPIFSNSPNAKNPHSHYAFWFENNQLQAVSTGDGAWKLQLPHQARSITSQPRATGGIPVNYRPLKINEAQLYHLGAEVSEITDVAQQHPTILAQLQAAAKAASTDLGDSLTKQPGLNQRSE
jgi:arylsulfatase A